MLVRSQRFDLIGGKEETMAGLAQLAEILARIVFHDDGEVRASFEVLFDRFDDRDLAVEGEIENVRAPLGPKANARAGAVFGVLDMQALQSAAIKVRIPLAHRRC